MKIKLVENVNTDNLKISLEEYLGDKLNFDSEEEKQEFLNDVASMVKEKEKERRASVVATAGRLSRNPGTVNRVLDLSDSKTLAQNNKFIGFVTGMGHSSITEHDYLVFAIEDVSPVVEQTIIAERFSSFTIKSRREVDFSQVGYIVPDFHDAKGNIVPENEFLKDLYQKYMNSLFSTYENFIELGISKEDARFILPYSFNSNILMGVDAHTLKDMIVKLTKTKYANITELKEFGEELYKIAEENVPYIIPLIDAVEEKTKDEVDEALSTYINDKDYKIIDKPVLLNHTDNVDDTIIISAIMRRYQFDYEKAKGIVDKMTEYDKLNIMRTIAFDSDKQELTQVNFEYQVPLSFAVLTHLTRHRTHQILIPDFAPNVDLTQYKVPPKIKAVCEKEYNEIFEQNKNMYETFKSFGVRDEDLVYFTLSGNMVNVVTQMDGKTLEHILRLRECNKAQWETKQMANGMHDEINKVVSARCFTKILGPTCETQLVCHEGKECCGKVYALQKGLNN